MSHAQEKRWLLGCLAFLAPLPLPFNENLEWAVLVVYLTIVAFFLRRVKSDAGSWLSHRAMNLVGGASLPFFYLDFFVLRSGQLIRPLIHLALFAAVVKLFGLHKEKDKWQTLAVVFFLFLASVGTSVHFAMIPYLLLFLGLAVTTLTRFTFFHVLARFGRESGGVSGVPIRGFVLTSTLAAVLIAIPLFALLPRMRTPYIRASGARGTGTIVHASGFTDELTMDRVGSIRESREVVLRARFQQELAVEREIRLKAATYDLFEGVSWQRSAIQGPLFRHDGPEFRLGDGAAENRMEIWLRPLGSRALPVPVEGLSLDLAVPSVVLDEGGALQLRNTPLSTFDYSVGIAGTPTSVAIPPEGQDDVTLDLSGLTPNMTALATEVAGLGTDSARARRLEAHLMMDYGYSTEFLGRSGAAPLEDFLFRHRRGHCEYFASSLVLLLRSQGIPARVVTGFLGAELNPLEGYFIVRQLNAHAWVEAYLPEEGGWTILDPTPPAGRPGVRDEGFGLLMRQVYDFVLFRWDRYVLTYSFYDQVRGMYGLWRMWKRFWTQLFPQRSPASDSGPSEALGDEVVPEVVEGGEAGTPWFWYLAAALLPFLVALIWWLLRRRSLDASEAYLKLRRAAERRGLEITDATPPLAFRDTLRERLPDHRWSVDQVVGGYVQESFGERPLDAQELHRLRERLRDVTRALRKAG